MAQREYCQWSFDYKPFPVARTPQSCIGSQVAGLGKLGRQAPFTGKLGALSSTLAHQPLLSPMDRPHAGSGNGRQGVWRLGPAACQASGRAASGLLRIGPDHGSASQQGAVCLPCMGQGACRPFYVSCSWLSPQEQAWEQQPLLGFLAGTWGKRRPGKH